jgi:hypothetical protein
MCTALVTSVWAAIGLAAATPVAMAQPAPSNNYTTVEAVPGKPLHIGTYGSANRKDCSPLRAPTIRVIESPASGSLSVRLGEATVDKMAGCPPIKVPMQTLAYTAKADADTDRIVYEVTSANGEVATNHVTIKILPKPTSPGIRKPEQKT